MMGLGKGALPSLKSPSPYTHQTSLPSNAQKIFLSLVPSTQVYKESKVTLGYDYDEEARILNPAMDNKLVAILEVYDVTGKYLNEDVTMGFCAQGVVNLHAYHKPFGKTDYEVRESLSNCCIFPYALSNIH